MYAVEIHQGIHKITSLFYRIGIWHRGDEPTTNERRIMRFYCFYYSFFFLSLLTGSITSDDVDDKIFSAEIAIFAGVMELKLWLSIWKQKQILELFNGICCYQIQDHDDYNKVNDKLSQFMKFVAALLVCISFGVCCEVVVPFIRSDKKLFVKIGFPLDFKNNPMAFWLTNIFLFTELCITIVTFLFEITLWYLLISCYLRYKVLGNDLKNMGKAKHNMFMRDFKRSTVSHVHIREYN